MDVTWFKDRYVPVHSRNDIQSALEDAVESGGVEEALGMVESAIYFLDMKITRYKIDIVRMEKHRTEFPDFPDNDWRMETLRNHYENLEIYEKDHRILLDNKSWLESIDEWEDTGTD